MRRSGVAFVLFPLTALVVEVLVVLLLAQLYHDLVDLGLVLGHLEVLGPHLCTLPNRLAEVLHLLVLHILLGHEHLLAHWHILGRLGPGLLNGPMVWERVWQG
mmetsp:Transcript_3781/g.3702  ORF Transcript_3781/g.3702 Transcript_3781/m.3702 type:complete len:103 (+) Transcript_3781:393-701(+)